MTGWPATELPPELPSDHFDVCSLEAQRPRSAAPSEAREPPPCNAGRGRPLERLVGRQTVLPEVVMPVGAIMLSCLHTAFLETSSRIRLGMGRFGRASRISSLLPWTIRNPRFTCVSDGNPFRRLLLTSKAVVGFDLVTFHGTSPATPGPGGAHSNATG